MLSLMRVENATLWYRRSEIAFVCFLFIDVLLSCHLAVNVLFWPAQVPLASTSQCTGVFVTKCHLCGWMRLQPLVAI